MYLSEFSKDLFLWFFYWFIEIILHHKNLCECMCRYVFIRQAERNLEKKTVCIWEREKEYRLVYLWRVFIMVISLCRYVFACLGTYSLYRKNKTSKRIKKKREVKWVRECISERLISTCTFLYIPNIVVIISFLPRLSLTLSVFVCVNTSN